MSQSKEEVEAELAEFKLANPTWLTDVEMRNFVASYNIRLANFAGNNCVVFIMWLLSGDFISSSR